MTLDSYISELLYKHDCVIIPALGGFVTNYQPAQINKLQNTFRPPSKSISFNKNLINNDGLLANFIAQKEKLSYPNACNRIEQEVQLINANLKNNKRINFKDIGVLFLDGNGKLNFEPAENINYLLDSYGLTIFQKQPIKRETFEEKITKEFKDRTIPLASVNKEKRSSKKWMIAAAITIPLTFFAIWIPNKYDLGTDISYANLNLFNPEIQALYVPKKTPISYEEENSKEESLKEKVAMADPNQNFISADINNSNFIIKLKKEVSAEPISTYVATKRKELHYHIVGGCFSNKINAKKMVRKLKREGFEAKIIGKRNGLWTVSYSSFYTRKEAVDFLSQAKNHNEKAWVLNY